jgi:hypothetical protein
MQDVMRVLEPLHAYDLIHLVVDVRRRFNLYIISRITSQCMIV